MLFVRFALEVCLRCCALLGFNFGILCWVSVLIEGIALRRCCLVDWLVVLNLVYCGCTLTLSCYCRFCVC